MSAPFGASFSMLRPNPRLPAARAPGPVADTPDLLHGEQLVALAQAERINLDVVAHNTDVLMDFHVAVGLAGFEHFIERRTSVWEFRAEIERILEECGVLEALRG
jgi:hypothetical protein